MYFRNETHKAIFKRITRKMNRSDKALMSKMYLLTGDRALWRAAKRESRNGNYSLGRIRLYCGTEDSYTLLCCAKDLTIGTSHITVADLADKEVISKKLNKMIRTAVAIRRYGIEYEEKQEKNGS